MRKKKPEKELNNERWLLTYSDLITLLMAFFIIMYGMSQVDSQKYAELASALSVSMGGGKNIVGTTNGASPLTQTKVAIDPNTATNKQSEEDTKLSNLKAQVDKYLSKSGLKGSVATSIDERGLVISFKDSLFFDIGKAEIKPEFAQRLTEIGKILNRLDNYVRVEGHTDNVPIKNNEFASNWQLSAIRATNVAEMLINNSKIDPKRLSALGYGEYRPIASNGTDYGRRKNRRVDIILMNSKFNKIENNKK